MCPKPLNRRNARPATKTLVDALEPRVLLSATAQFGNGAVRSAVRRHLMANGRSLPVHAIEVNLATSANSLGTTGNITDVNSPDWNSTYNSASDGLTPTQISQAYAFNQLMVGGSVANGTGQTIAIIDAYNDPTITSDLHAFDVKFGLSDPTFTILNQSGGTTLPGTDPAGPGDSWAIETSLDVEWAHALAPGANIVLIEANSTSTSDLYAAVDTARNISGVSAISMSWGHQETPSDPASNTYFTTPAGHSGIVFVASTGDSGMPGEYPAYSPNVLAVGGTSLTLSNNTYAGETGWSGSGGGISDYESKPGFQAIVTQSSTYRTTPDVSFDAAANTGVAIYDSYDGGTSDPWGGVYGTSFSSPAWAALVALADQVRAAHGIGTLDSSTLLNDLYNLPSSDFHDITTGNNGYAAATGYDLVTGIGTPIVNQLVADVGGPAAISNGTLTITGTNSADGISASMSAGVITVTTDSITQRFSSTNVNSIVINGLNGDDTISVDSSVTLPTTINAGLGNCTVTGTPNVTVSYAGSPLPVLLTATDSGATGTIYNQGTPQSTSHFYGITSFHTSSQGDTFDMENYTVGYSIYGSAWVTWANSNLPVALTATDSEAVGTIYNQGTPQSTSHFYGVTTFQASSRGDTFDMENYTLGYSIYGNSSTWVTWASSNLPVALTATDSGAVGTIYNQGTPQSTSHFYGITSFQASSKGDSFDMENYAVGYAIYGNSSTWVFWADNSSPVSFAITSSAISGTIYNNGVVESSTYLYGVTTFLGSPQKDSYYDNDPSDSLITIWGDGGNDNAPTYGPSAPNPPGLHYNPGAPS